MEAELMRRVAVCAIRRLVWALSPDLGAKAGYFIRTGYGNGPHRRQDRASRRSQSEPRRCQRSLACAQPAGDIRRTALLDAAERHWVVRRLM